MRQDVNRSARRVRGGVLPCVLPRLAGSRQKRTESVAPTSAWEPTDLTPKRPATSLPGSVAFVGLRHLQLRELRARCSTNLRRRSDPRQRVRPGNLRKMRTILTGANLTAGDVVKMWVTCV